MAPKTMGQVDEDWIAGCIVRHTQLTWSVVSTCRSFDSKSVLMFWQVLMNTSLSCRFPEECKAKPVLSLVVDARVLELGEVFKELKVDDVHIFAGGKFNRSNIRIFRPKHASDEDRLETIFHLYIKKEANIYGEDIDSTVDIDQNWLANAAKLKRGNRSHGIIGFWKSAEHGAMMPWSGHPQVLVDAVADAVAKINAITTSTKIEEAHDKFTEEFNKQRRQAMHQARERLAQSKQDSARKRRISAADAA